MPVKLPDIPLSLPLGHFRMQHLIGQGARGVVYQAEDTRTGHPVAIKFMGIPEDMDGREARLRFDREARTLSHFSHPHIVRFESMGTVQWGNAELPYLAMEFLPDLEPLDVAATRHNDPDWVLDRIEELLAALDYMHSHADPVVHRDLKPGNLGIPADGRLRVLDLGLAREKMSELTNQGAAMGSLGYMAPEQLMDAKNVDGRADIYSVGMIVLELLGGGHPLRNMTSGRTVRAVISGKIPPTPEPIPEPLERLARWWCALSPKERPATASAALRELRGVRLRLKGSTSAAGPVEAAAPSGWETSVAFLGQQLAQTRDGQGNAVLVCGRTDPDRRMLLDATCQRAQVMGMAVWHIEHSTQLAQWLGCGLDEQSLFEGLSSAAESTPLVMAVPDLQPDDWPLYRMLHMAVRSGEPVLILAASQQSPADPGRLTIMHLR